MRFAFRREQSTVDGIRASETWIPTGFCLRLIEFLSLFCRLFPAHLKSRCGESETLFVNAAAIIEGGD